MKSKKIAAILAAISVFAATVPITALAADDVDNPDFSKPGDEYSSETIVDESGNLVIEGTTVTGVTEQGKTAAEIVIPNGVTIIDNNAFKGCTSLKTIKIPEGVVSLESGAFVDCSSLESITLPDSLTSLAGDIFNGCSGLESINVGENNKRYCSENGVLFNKNKTTLWAYPKKGELSSYTIPDTVNTIQNFAFYGSTNLMNVTIPDQVTEIGRYTFFGCENLKHITLPEGVTAINAGTFANCSSLSSITIPKSVKSIGNTAFSLCKSLTSVELQDGLTSIGANAFANCTSLTDITIPTSVTEIGRGAFGMCTGLTEVTIPESITKIDGLFYDCSNLRTVNIPGSVTEITISAFDGCNNLTDIYYDGTRTDWLKISVTDENGGAYSINSAAGFATVHYKTSDPEDNVKDPSECLVIEGASVIGVTEKGRNAAEITIPEGIVEIADKAFLSCRSLEKITVPEGVVTIGYEAFAGCVNLSSINLPVGLQEIYSGAFNYCPSLKNIVIPEGVFTLSSDMFVDCYSLESVTLPATLNRIDGAVFLRCTALKNITVDENNECFCSENGVLFSKDKTVLYAYPAKNGTGFTIPDSVIEIFDWTFTSCNDLTSITIPENVKSIGYAAFSYCENLETVKIPAGVKTIYSDAFRGCSSLKTLEIDENNPYYTYADGALLSKDKKTLYEYLYGNGNSYTIPDYVTSIGEEAFAYVDIKSVVIPAGVTEISYDAFYECESLTDIRYTGTKEDWDKITISNNYSGNPNLSASSLFNGATIRYGKSENPGEKPVVEYTASEETGITITAEEDVIEEGSVLKVERLDETTSETDAGKFRFDISFIKDGEEVQPKAGSKVTVKIPVPPALENVTYIYVYHVLNGKYYNMKAYVIDGYIVFETDHFSEYVVTSIEVEGAIDNDSVDTSDSTDDEDEDYDADDTDDDDTDTNPSDSSQSTADKSPNTGFGGIAVTLGVFALAGAAIVAAKKKK